MFFSIILYQTPYYRLIGDIFIIFYCYFLHRLKIWVFRCIQFYYIKARIINKRPIIIQLNKILLLRKCLIIEKYDLLQKIFFWSHMQKGNQTWQNHSIKNPKHAKTYGLNSSQTTISHIATHEFIATQNMQQVEPNKIIMTMATFDCDFAILQNFYETGHIVGDLEFKQRLRVKTTYPILHCHLDYQFIESYSKIYLIAYLIDIYSNIYTVNLTKSLEYSQKYPTHPVQFRRLYQNTRGVQKGQTLYLQTPLMIKKYSMGIITVNLKGQIGLLDFNQSRSFMAGYDLQMEKYNLNIKALAANHNHAKCKYQSVVLVATNNNRAPYVFINCNSLTDFQNQKKAQDKYEWMEDQVQVSYCSIDASTNLVAVSTVAQNISIYEIVSAKQDKTSFFYLKKKFGFFVANNLHFSNIDINYNIESIHAAKALILIITSKEYIIYDLVQRIIGKRGKSTQISMLKWGGIIDRNQNLVAAYIVKGFNHINQPQSKIGKPNIHFKTLDLSKKDKNS